jgi:endo-1,4-beta-xylanase
MCSRCIRFMDEVAGAVIIAPGGGHMQLTIDREGYDLARGLAERGIAAFVLKNRLARDTSTPRGTAQPYTIDRDALAEQLQTHLASHPVRASNGGVDPLVLLGLGAAAESDLDVARPDQARYASPRPPRR